MFKSLFALLLPITETTRDQRTVFRRAWWSIALWLLFAVAALASGIGLLVLFVMYPAADFKSLLAVLGIASMIVGGAGALWLTIKTRNDRCIVTRDRVTIFYALRYWSASYDEIRRIEWFHTIEGGGRHRIRSEHTVFFLHDGNRIRFEGLLVNVASRLVAENMIAARLLDPEDAFQDGKRASHEV